MQPEMALRGPRRVAVYCGSSSGHDGRFVRLAWDLGGALARANIALVYGGGQVGLMGALVDGVLASGGDAIGVIPDFLMTKERTHADARVDIRVVGSMHERKAMYYALADAFIALPGGLGTFEELFETLAWAHLGLVRGPVILFNEGMYYDAVIALLDKAVATGFMSERQRSLVTEAASIADVLSLLVAGP
jgi:uncharacterized protein (TIGR00730 family)